MTDKHQTPNQAAETSMGRGMLYISWIIAFVLLTFGASHWLTKRDNPNAMPASTSAAGVNTVTLKQNRQHHYVATGYINEGKATFFVDTGATHVSVPAHLADELGLKPGMRGYAVTANGTVEVSSTIIDSLRIGSITLNNIRASINPGMEQDQILLGMSALKNIEFTQRDGTLTLTQYH